MKTKHTPGKWYQSHRQIPNDENGGYATQVYTEDGETIATLHWYPMPPQKEIHNGKEVSVTGTYRSANARLIAAAPELLEALIEIDRLYGDRSDYIGEYKKAWEKTKAAIKKAQGE